MRTALRVASPPPPWQLSQAVPTRELRSVFQTPSPRPNLGELGARSAALATQSWVVQLLISAPGDVPPGHLQVIEGTIAQWNRAHGRHYGLIFTSTDWSGTAPAFGDYPQDVINRQIVNSADAAIAVFADRLGTPTPSHPSGTAEEIEVLRAAGKHVGILLNECPRAAPGKDEMEQRSKLLEYVDEVRTEALTRSYTDLGQLDIITQNVLNFLASTFMDDAQEALRGTVRSSARPPIEASDPAEGVWPRVEFTDHVVAKKDGSSSVVRKFFVVIASNVNRPVNNVSWRFEDGDGNRVDFDGGYSEQLGGIALLPPNGSQHFILEQDFGSASNALCIVNWTDTDGSQRETKATVRSM